MKEIETIQDLASGTYNIKLKNANLITGDLSGLEGVQHIAIRQAKLDLEHLKSMQYISLT